MNKLTEDIKRSVKQTLAEDIGSGDLTASLIPEGVTATAEIICRESAVLCGQAWLEEVFEQLNQTIKIQWFFHDGDAIEADQIVCKIIGSASDLLTGERSALNFLQTLSATATKSRFFVDLVDGVDVRILDTRKTIPGLRSAQKYAVTCGGASNHRIGLFDAILIKENHISAAGSISAAVKKAVEHDVEIEVEVEDLDEFEEALSVGVKRVLLDNFSISELILAVGLNKGRARLEASGNVTEHTIRDIAETGVDDISLGTLTKDVKAVDFSMLFKYDV